MPIANELGLEVVGYELIWVADNFEGDGIYGMYLSVYLGLHKEHSNIDNTIFQIERTGRYDRVWPRICTATLVHTTLLV